MQLSENGLWARLYRRSRLLCTTFVNYRGDPRLYRTDLCTFVRTIFVWAPLVVALNVAAVAVAVTACFALLWTMWLHLTVVGGIVLSILAIAVFVTAVYFIIGLGETVAKSETTALAREYLKAKKSAICPLINIKEDTHASA